jgi:hypothetical protein
MSTTSNNELQAPKGYKALSMEDLHKADAIYNGTKIVPRDLSGSWVRNAFPFHVDHWTGENSSTVRTHTFNSTSLELLGFIPLKRVYEIPREFVWECVSPQYGVPLEVVGGKFKCVEILDEESK